MFTALICTHLEIGHASGVEQGLLYLCRSKMTSRAPSLQGLSSAMNFLIWLCVPIFNLKVAARSLLVSMKSFFCYVLTFELNGLTTLCSIRTCTRMAGVYAQLILKNPIKGEPLLFYAEKKARLIAHEVPTPESVCPPSPSSYVDLGGIGGVIYLHISVAETITLLYIVQSYSLSI